MKTYPLDKGHFLKINLISDDNRRYKSAQVYKDKTQVMPEFYSQFPAHTDLEEIISWANNHINNPPKNDFMKNEQPKMYKLLSSEGYGGFYLKGHIYPETEVKYEIANHPEDWQLVTDEPETFKPTHLLSNGRFDNTPVRIVGADNPMVLVEVESGAQLNVTRNLLRPLQDERTTLTDTQYDSLVKAFYNAIMNSNDELGMADMGECKDEATRIVREWAHQNKITLP